MAAKSNVLAAWGERLWKWSSPLLSSPWVATTIWGVLAAGIAAMKWLFAAIPWWFLAISALFAAILVAQLFIFVRRAMAIRGLKTLDIQEVGKDCVTFRADVMEYLVARVDAGAGRRIAGPSNAEAVHAEWARNVDYSNQTRARIVEKFAHRAIAISHLLQLAGIKPPDLWAFDNRAADVAIYIGAVGDLMGRGLLNEARSMDPGHDNRMMVYLG
jgi:hypothetical protein